jgi:DNA-binding winged helix-turn-helix (wHTH) protein
VSDTVLFDPANQLLTIAGERAQLSPKAFSVLDYLNQHKQKLVTKEDLLGAVWPDVFVTDAVLKVAVGELRKALNDHPKQPTFIETVHRKGYRFIGEMALAGGTDTSITIASTQTSNNAALFGRDNAIQKIDECWAKALSGTTQILFVNGEAGFGKSSVINHWLNEHAESPSNHLFTCVACFNQHDSSEPYLPILNALGSLVKHPQHDTIKSLLRQYAPSWLLQMPSLLSEQEQEALKKELFGVTKQRMLREFVDFIEAITQDIPLCLCIEDLHWCDNASLDLIMALAQRSSLKQFMLLSSFRTSELRQDTSTLKYLYNQLQLKNLCQTVDLLALNEIEIKKCLQQNLPVALHGEVYFELFKRYTEGNPLMLMTAIEHINQSFASRSDEIEGLASEAQGVDPQQVEDGISGGLKQLLSLKIANLNKDDRQLLQAASVSTTQFATESIAAVLKRDVLDIEEACEDQLLHEQWLVPGGSENWPDGSISESYRFWHQLYRQFFYDMLSAARRRHYHLSFATRLLSGHEGKLSDLAPQLAYHFEAGGDVQQAIEFRKLAAQQSAQRFAYNEAIQHITKVISLSATLQDPAINLDARKQHCSFLLASGKLPETISGFKELIGVSQKAAAHQCEIDATLGLADALFWIDRQACLATAKNAVTLSEDLADKDLIIHTKGKYAHFRSVIEEYHTDYTLDYEAAFQLALKADDTTLKRVHYPRHLYYLIIKSEYHKANELAETTRKLALETGDAASYLSCEFFHAWALFYEGRWGEMLQVMDSSLELAKKNEHTPWVLHFQLQKAWLLLHVFDYEGAHALCQPIYQTISNGPDNGLYFFSSIILMRLKIRATGQTHEYDYVSEVLGRLDVNPMAIDWVLRFPLQQALAEHHLANKQWEAARNAAEALQTLALRSGEKTYLAMSEYFLARTSIGEQNPVATTTHLEQAKQVLATSELPVVAWRIYGLDKDEPQTQNAVNHLLQNMALETTLHQSFKAAEEIIAVI